MNTDRELQYGPGMRIQRLLEAAFLIAAVFTQDVRFAWVTFVLTVLQALSPRWVPIAQVVARLVRFGGQYRIGDMYFDLGGVRGAAAISVLAQGTALALIQTGWRTTGFVLLTVPAASFLMAPTLGFCAGCWFYVLGRDWLARRGWLNGGFDDHHDITIDGGPPADQPQLRAASQR